MAAPPIDKDVAWSLLQQIGISRAEFDQMRDEELMAFVESINDSKNQSYAHADANYEAREMTLAEQASALLSDDYKIKMATRGMKPDVTYDLEKDMDEIQTRVEAILKVRRDTM